jgi:hypothetical protein
MTNYTLKRYFQIAFICCAMLCSSSAQAEVKTTCSKQNEIYEKLCPGKLNTIECTGLTVKNLDEVLQHIEALPQLTVEKQNLAYEILVNAKSQNDLERTVAVSSEICYTPIQRLFNLVIDSNKVATAEQKKKLSKLLLNRINNISQIYPHVLEIAIFVNALNRAVEENYILASAQQKLEITKLKADLKLKTKENNLVNNDEALKNFESTKKLFLRDIDLAREYRLKLLDFAAKLD